ncbi:flagellar biosynthesis protein FlgM, partial [bacterium]
MQWKNRRQSENVEDQRGMGMGKTVSVGGGIGTIVLALAIYLLGGDPGAVLDTGGSSTRTTTTRQTGQGSRSPKNDEAKQFVSTVLADTEETWGLFFKQRG